MQILTLIFVAGSLCSSVFGQSYYGSSQTVTSSPGPANYRVVGIASPNSKFLQQGSDGQWTGFIPDYLNALVAAANPTFSYTISNQPDGKYGNLDANGNWNGLIGQLVSKTADVVAADLSITYQRGTVVDFAVPYLTYNVVVLTQPGASLNNIKYAVEDNADLVFLQSSQDPSIQAIWANVQANKPQSIVSGRDAGIALVQQGGWAFVTEDVSVCGSGNSSTCPSGVTYTGPSLKQGFYALAVQSGSPARNVLALATEKIEDQGILIQLLKKWKLRD